MSEMILETNILPEPIFGMIDSKKVMVVKDGNKIIISPVFSAEEKRHPLRGKYKDSGLTLEEFRAWRKQDKEMEF